jgi:transcriptional regulator with XRE-family HTH domain
MTRRTPHPITNFESMASELRQLRRERHLSQQVLAERAGVSRRTITNAEGGQNIGLNELCRIASALGHDVTLRPKNSVVFEDLPLFFREDE